MIDSSILIDLLQKVINKSNFSETPSPNRWKYCVALAACGWKATEYKKINNDVVITWKKENTKDVLIRMSFADQCLWLDYLQKKNKERKINNV